MNFALLNNRPLSTNIGALRQPAPQDNIDMTEPVDGNPFAAPVVNLQPRDAAFVLAGRVVGADRPVEWLKFGFALFKRDPGIWIALVVVVFLLLAVMHVVPGLGSLAAGRIGHTATLLPTGKVLVVGGSTDGIGGFLASAELFN